MKNWRRILGITTAVVTLAAFAAGCGGGSSSASSSGGSAAPAEEKTEEAAASSDEVYVMKVACSNPQESSLGTNLLYFEEKVEELTNGRVDVVPYLNGTLCSTMDEINSVLDGSAQACSTVNAVADTIIPIENIPTIPFLITVDPGDYKLQLALETDPELQGILNEEAEKVGLKRLGSVPATLGLYLVGNNVRPVEKFSDMKGLTIRCAGGEMYNIILNAVGASPVQITVAETAVALYQGTVDGLLTNLTWSHPANIHTKYLSLPWFMECSTPYYVNMDFWNSLPADIQDIIENQVMPDVKKHACELMGEWEVKFLEEIQEEPYNTEISYIDFTDPENAAIIEQVRDAGRDYYLNICGEAGQKAYDRVLAIKAEQGYE